MNKTRKNAFWIALAAPGILWLLVLFIVPVYAVLAIGMGKLDQLIEAPVAVWNPLDWSSSGVIDVWRDIFGSSAFARPVPGRGVALALARFAALVHVTLPLSRQPILTGLLITVLPMLGDYYTNQLLSGAASTSMIGNLIQGQLGTPGVEGQGAALWLLLLVVLLIPMIYYVIATNREAAQ